VRAPSWSHPSRRGARAPRWSMPGHGGGRVIRTPPCVFPQVPVYRTQAGADEKDCTAPAAGPGRQRGGRGHALAQRDRRRARAVDGQPLQLLHLAGAGCDGGVTPPWLHLQPRSRVPLCRPPKPDRARGGTARRAPHCQCSGTSIGVEFSVSALSVVEAPNTAVPGASHGAVGCPHPGRTQPRLLRACTGATASFSPAQFSFTPRITYYAEANDGTEMTRMTGSPSSLHASDQDVAVPRRAAALRVLRRGGPLRQVHLPPQGTSAPPLLLLAS
jgi:hypothetical protein